MAPHPKQIYGLIGYPVKHSLSPAMYNAAFAALGMDAEYKLFEVKPEEVGDFLQSLSQKNICGLNVTVPHKERVLDFIELDKESFYLRQIRAVNTIVKEGVLLKGFNTDIPGFEKHLKEQFDPGNKRCAIIGAGGASRAVSYVLAKAGAKEIAVFDIERPKADGIVRMIQVIFHNFPIAAAATVEELDIANKDLLVNATPVGLKPADPCLISKEMLHKDLFVYDLIYNPAETKLLQLAKKAGAATSNGLGMLLYQGMLSFKIWTGKDAPGEVMCRALVDALEKHK